MLNSQTFYPPAAIRELNLSAIREKILVKAMNEILVLNPSPLVQAILEDAKAEAEKHIW